MQETVKKKNKKSKYIISFILFFFIGGVLGGFGTYKTLGMKEDKKETKNVEKKKEKEPEVLDITKDPDYVEIINNLHDYLGKDSIFYSSLGVDLEKMSNDNKLRVTYEYIESNNLFATETLQPAYYGSLTCNNNFNLDVIVAADGSLSNGTICTVNTITLENFINNYKKIFNNENIDVSQPFNPKSTKSCVIVDNSYQCGNVNNSNISGSLDSKFEVVKAIKEKDKITIYDKGYLVDTRSSVVNPDDGHDNYYLHSSDSTTYYYELKSADNLTFAHTFVKGKDNNYRYNGTSVVQE